jgi:hypothetical protein
VRGSECAADYFFLCRHLFFALLLCHVVAAAYYADDALLSRYILRAYEPHYIMPKERKVLLMKDELILMSIIVFYFCDYIICCHYVCYDYYILLRHEPHIFRLLYEYYAYTRHFLPL